MEKKEEIICRSMARMLNIEYVDLDNTDIDIDAVRSITDKLARERLVLPYRIEGDIIRVAMADPADFQTIADIKITAKKTPVPALASETSIRFLQDKYYSGSEKAKAAVKEFAEENADSADVEDVNGAEIESAPVVRVVNSILSEAITVKASDIHIEPFENGIRVRERLDGDLKEMMTLPKNMLQGLVTRIKIMSSLNIAETKRPQDGRINLKTARGSINMRISFIPTVFGEKIVIRLLNRDMGVMNRKDLGFSPYNYDQVDKLMKISEGVVLVTGPTGSGKTTTLYSILKELNRVNKNIITLEDPVEYQMFGINQVQVNTETGMTFASGLRSILRQDPDIIMLGEIRDEETAEIAIRSAITGHVVLSTLHTNDTASSITRLVDMNVPKYMVTSAVSGIIAQRLLKRICTECIEEYEADYSEKQMLRTDGKIKLHRGKGCPYCNGTGYKGRISIHEVMVLTPEIKSMINSGKTEEEIKQYAVAHGMKTLADSAAELVMKGITTVSEMERATYILQ